MVPIPGFAAAPVSKWFAFRAPSCRRRQLPDPVPRQRPTTAKASRLAVLVDKPERVRALTPPLDTGRRRESTPDLEPPRLGVLVVGRRAACALVPGVAPAAVRAIAGGARPVGGDCGSTTAAPALVHSQEAT